MENQVSKKECFHFHPGLILLMIILSQLLSCKPETLDVKMPQAAEKPAIASQYGIDGIFGLVLSKSFDAGKQIYTADSNGIQYDSSLLLSGAIIQIKGGGNTLTASWSKMAASIDYTSNETPDSASISILVGYSDTPTVGTIFMIDDLSFTTATAINESSIENGLNLYPNPSAGEVNIILNNAPSKDLQISLKDISGRTIKSYSNEELILYENEIKLKINSYEPGIYFMEMKSNNKVFTKRIILQ